MCRTMHSRIRNAYETRVCQYNIHSVLFMHNHETRNVFRINYYKKIIKLTFSSRYIVTIASDRSNSITVIAITLSRTFFSFRQYITCATHVLTSRRLKYFRLRTRTSAYSQTYEHRNLDIFFPLRRTVFRNAIEVRRNRIEI